jgi:hypothetical protein
MFRRLFVILAAAVVASSCNKDTTPTPVPTPIAPPTTTENYSGTLFVLGSNLHSFAVKLPSEVDVTLTAVATVAVPADPTANPPVVGVPSVPVTVPLTLRVGQPTLTTIGVQCSDLMSVSTTAGSAPQLKGQALAGTYCVSISDPDDVLPSAVSYAITVSHS